MSMETILGIKQIARFFIHLVFCFQSGGQVFIINFLWLVAMSLCCSDHGSCATTFSEFAYTMHPSSRLFFFCLTQHSFLHHQAIATQTHQGYAE